MPARRLSAEATPTTAAAAASWMQVTFIFFLLLNE